MRLVREKLEVEQGEQDQDLGSPPCLLEQCGGLGGKRNSAEVHLPTQPGLGRHAVKPFPCCTHLLYSLAVLTPAAKSKSLGESSDSNDAQHPHQDFESELGCIAPRLFNCSARTKPLPNLSDKCTGGTKDAVLVSNPVDFQLGQDDKNVGLGWGEVDGFQGLFFAPPGGR